MSCPINNILEVIYLQPRVLCTSLRYFFDPVNGINASEAKRFVVVVKDEELVCFQINKLSCEGLDLYKRHTSHVAYHYC